MQFLSKPPMSRKIRPPKVIVQAVFEIVPIGVLSEPVPEEPEYEPPPVDVSRHVMMECLFAAISQQVIAQIGDVHTPNVVDMQLHRVKGWIDPLESEIRMDAMMQYADKSEDPGLQKECFFGLTQYFEPPLFSILNDIRATVYDIEPIPSPISMIHSYNMDTKKLLNYFEMMKPIHVEDTYTDTMIQSIMPYTGSYVGPMLKSVEFDLNETEPVLRRIDMMKYVGVGDFHMINSLYNPISSSEPPDRNMIYTVHSVDTHKINQLFCRIHSDYSYLETREIVMEMYSAHNGILALLEKINECEISPYAERSDVDLFGMNHSIKLMDMIELLDVYELLNDFADRSADPYISLGNPTAKIQPISNIVRESTQVGFAQSVHPAVDMVDTMNITPLPFTQVELEPTPTAVCMKITTNPACVGEEYVLGLHIKPSVESNDRVRSSVNFAFSPAQVDEESISGLHIKYGLESNDNVKASMNFAFSPAPPRKPEETKPADKDPDERIVPVPPPVRPSVNFAFSPAPIREVDEEIDVIPPPIRPSVNFAFSPAPVRKTEDTPPEPEPEPEDQIVSIPPPIRHMVNFTMLPATEHKSEDSEFDEQIVSIPPPIRRPVNFTILPATVRTTDDTQSADNEPYKQYVSISLPVKSQVTCIEPDQEMKPENRIILSLTTTGIRAFKFMQIIHRLEETLGVYRVIINVCTQFKRMGTYMSPEEIESIKTHPAITRLNSAYSYDKYMVFITEDFGPITKMTGGMEYMINTKSVYYTLIIIDDDTIYENSCLALLESQKKPNTIVSGSGFLFYDYLEYVMASTQSQNTPVDIVEGFAGICFDYSDINKRLLRFIRYYRTINWADNAPDEVNLFLKACFMGDDFIISYFYHHASYQLVKVNGLLGSIHQSDFGFLPDALHRNSIFKSNMGTYVYIYRHIDILETFMRKIEVCRRIAYKTNIYYK